MIHPDAEAYRQAAIAALNTPPGLACGGSPTVLLVTTRALMATYVLLFAWLMWWEARELVYYSDAPIVGGVTILVSVLSVWFLLPWSMALVQHFAVGGVLNSDAAEYCEPYFSVSKNQWTDSASVGLWGRGATALFYLLGAMSFYGLIHRLAWVLKQF